MKKLLLLSALLIFACNSDDSSDTNDSSNQTFLERYDGVVWQSEGSEELIRLSFDLKINRTNYLRIRLF